MSQPSLRSEVASAGKWSAASTVLVTILQFARSIILASVLSPAELGLFAMAMVAVSLFRCLADGGMANAIIYKQTTDSKVLSSIHWINVVIGIAIGLVICAGSPAVAWYFKQPALRNVVLVMAVGPFIRSWSIVIDAILRTELRFRSLCIVKVGGALVSLVVAVACALNGLGVWSIVWGYLVASLSEVVFSYSQAIDYSRPRMVFDRNGLGEYLRFGGYQMSERFINFLGANADYFIIGRMLGEEALGIYRIAFEMVVMPLNRINPIVTNVVLPGFAKVKDPERFRRAYLEVIRFLASVTVPCLLGLWAIAPLFVEIAYDPRYASAAGLIRILVIVGVFRTLCSPIGVALISLGRPDLGFFWNVGLTAVSIPVFMVLAPHGTAAVAWGYAALMVISFVLLNGPILARMLPTTFLDVVKQVYLPMLLSVLMAAIVVLATRLAMPIEWPLVTLGCLIFTGVVCYVAMTALADRSYVRSVLLTLFGKRT